MKLKPGVIAAAVIKSTNVVVELPDFTPKDNFQNETIRKYMPRNFLLGFNLSCSASSDSLQVLAAAS